MHFTPDDAVYEFRKRIEYYEMIYSPLNVERNYIRMNSLYNRILEEKLLDSIPLYSRIRDFLVTDVVTNLYPSGIQKLFLMWKTASAATLY